MANKDGPIREWPEKKSNEREWPEKGKSKPKR